MPRHGADCPEARSSPFEGFEKTDCSSVEAGGDLRASLWPRNSRGMDGAICSHRWLVRRILLELRLPTEIPRAGRRQKGIKKHTALRVREPDWKSFNL